MICIDPYGWLERLLDGPRSRPYNSVIDRVARTEIITSVVSLDEVSEKLRPIRGEAAALEAVARPRATRIDPVDDLIALEAADHSRKLGLPISDALICAAARHIHAELHTRDTSMNRQPGVTFH